MFFFVCFCSIRPSEVKQRSIAFLFGGDCGFLVCVYWRRLIFDGFLRVFQGGGFDFGSYSNSLQESQTNHRLIELGPRWRLKNLPLGHSYRVAVAKFYTLSLPIFTMFYMFFDYIM